MDYDTPLLPEVMKASFQSRITIKAVLKEDIENKLNIKSETLNKEYSNIEEIIEIQGISEEYDIVEYSEDNTIWNRVDNPGKEVTLQKKYTKPGTYQMYFKDEMGNTIVGTVSTTKLDQENPIIGMNAYEKENGIEIDLSDSKDQQSGIYRYYYKLENEEWIESDEKKYWFNPLQDGEYKVSVKIEDNAGNITEEETRQIVVAYEQVYISNTGNDTTGNGAKNNPYATLQVAYNKVKSGGEMILLSNITATNRTNMNILNKKITIRSNGTNVYSVIRGNSLTSNILNIANSNLVTISNVIFDGNNVNSQNPLILAKSSTLNLQEGTVVQNAKNVSSKGGALQIENSVLNINGATIKNNKVQTNSWAQGAGIAAGTNSTINMNSGIISNNIVSTTASNAYAEGGGIYLWESNINFRGGEIKQNQAQKGGGICLVSSTSTATMNMTNGFLSQNGASIHGGGILVTKASSNSANSIFYIKGGSISSNTAPTGPNSYAVNGAQIIDQR